MTFCVIWCWSVIILMTNKLDKAVVPFHDHSYDYRLNQTPLSYVTILETTHKILLLEVSSHIVAHVEGGTSLSSNCTPSSAPHGTRLIGKTTAPGATTRPSPHRPSHATSWTTPEPSTGHGHIESSVVFPLVKDIGLFRWVIQCNHSFKGSLRRRKTRWHILFLRF